MPLTPDQQPVVSPEISGETIAYIVMLARAFDAQVAASGGADASNPSDDQAVGALELHEGGLAETELTAAIESLSEDERAVLIALFWVGRGDFSPSEFADAVAIARSGEAVRASRYLLRQPLLGDMIEDGAEGCGVSMVFETVDVLGHSHRTGPD